MNQEYYAVESVNPTENPIPGPSMSPEYSRQSAVSVNPTDSEPSMIQVCAKKKKRREKVFESYMRSNYPKPPRLNVTRRNCYKSEYGTILNSL